MKRFWLFALLIASSLAVLTAPSFAAKGEEAASDDSSSESSMDDVNSAIGSLSSRVGDMEKTLGLKFFGDVRLRVDWRTQAQADVTTENSTGTALISGGAINDQVRPRYRVRFGATKQFGDVAAGFRLATGGGNNPNSENQTFDAGFVDPNMAIDQAYILWTPGFLDGHLKLGAGKMPNPLSVTPITWDPDIVPEGFLAEVSYMPTNTKLRATYFDVNNQNAGGALALGSPVSLYLTGSNTDEFMANFQLEQLLQVDKDTSATVMVGYEYIPYVTALAGGTLIAPPGGALALNNALVSGGADGMIWNYGKIIPDISMIEAMITIKNKIGDIPLKWVLHAIDNLNSFNVPDGNPLSAAPPAAGTYTAFTNQYGYYASVNIGEVKMKNDMAGFLSVGYLEPNAQLGFLTDDDPGNNNREYFKGTFTYGLEDNVQLVLSEFATYHVYYAYLGAPNNKLGGTSQDPEFITMFDCLASF